jgi:hypothetical protein
MVMCLSPLRPRSVPRHALPPAATAGSVHGTPCEVPVFPAGVPRCQSLVVFVVSPTEAVVHVPVLSKLSVANETT